jgi:hypothetical protein
MVTQKYPAPFGAEEARSAKLRANLSANRDRNWLLALTLNAFAQLDANMPLTDIEKAIVENCRKHGVSDATLRAHGRLCRQLPASVRDDIFRGKFADLTEHSHTPSMISSSVPGNPLT